MASTRLADAGGLWSLAGESAGIFFFVLGLAALGGLAVPHEVWCRLRRSERAKPLPQPSQVYGRSPKSEQAATVKVSVSSPT